MDGLKSCLLVDIINVLYTFKSESIQSNNCSGRSLASYLDNSEEDQSCTESYLRGSAFV